LRCAQAALSRASVQAGVQGVAGHPLGSGNVDAVTGRAGDRDRDVLLSGAVARELDANCHTPLGAHAVPAGCGCLNLRAWVGLPDGSAWLRDSVSGDPAGIGLECAQRMLAAGAAELLARAEAELAV